MSDVRICSTKKLQSFMAAANQHVDVELDKDGTHALQVLDTTWDGLVKLYVCDVVLKVKDSKAPHRGKITLRAEDFDSLLSATVGF